MNTQEFKQHAETLIKVFGEEKAVNKLVPYSIRYLQDKKITEISIKDFASISGLNCKMSKQILLKINSYYFKKKNGI
jgi:hypothetical protein